MQDPTSTFVQVLATCCLALPALAQKQPDVRVSLGRAPGTANAFLSSIAASGSAVYVAFEDDRNGTSDIYFNRSLDGGASWLAAATRLNVGATLGSSMAFNPMVAAAGELVYVVWEDDRNGSSDVFFNRSLDGGASWLASDVRLATGAVAGASAAFMPHIAVDGPLVYVVWTDTRSGQTDIYFNRSFDAGTTWLPTDVRLDVGAQSGTTFAGDAQIAATALSVYVVWVDGRNGGTDVYSNASQDGGATWLQSDVQLNVGAAPSSTAYSPRIAAFGTLVYVVYEDYQTNFKPDIYFNGSIDGGVTWQPNAVRLSVGRAPGASSSFAPKIATSGSFVYVAWEDDRNTQNTSDIYFNRSTDVGMTWLPAAVRLDVGSPPGAAPSYATQIAASDQSVTVVWEDDRNGGISDIYCNRSLDAGTTWLATDVRLDLGNAPGASGSYNPQIAAGSGSIYVTWDDDRSNGSSQDIYFNLASGFQPYGTGTAGANGMVPALSGSGAATIGGTAVLDFSNGLGGALGLLAIGAGPASQVAQPLLGGTLLVSPGASLLFFLSGTPGTAGAGTQSIPVPVPDHANLLGLDINFQGLFLDSGAVGGVSMSNGMETWIG